MFRAIELSNRLHNLLGSHVTVFTFTQNVAALHTFTPAPGR